MKREALGVAGIAAIALPLILQVDSHTALALSGCRGAGQDFEDGDNWYAQQYTHKGYKGQFGWFHTYAPAVPDP